MASKRAELEELQAKMAAFKKKQSRLKKEVERETQGKLYKALKGYITDEQLEICTLDDIRSIVMAHLNGQPHALDEPEALKAYPKDKKPQTGAQQGQSAAPGAEAQPVQAGMAAQVQPQGAAVQGQVANAAP